MTYMTLESRQTHAVEDGPEIVCLCGSTRFYDEFQRANYRLTMAGKIVLTVGFYPHNPQVHGEGVGATTDQKADLDELHKRKVDLAHRVLVLNVGGYIGDSTRSEIAYAERRGVPVEYLEPVGGGTEVHVPDGPDAGPCGKQGHGLGCTCDMPERAVSDGHSPATGAER